MRKAALVGLIVLALVACNAGPPAITSSTTAVKRVNQSDAESQAERTVEVWNPDWRPFVYGYAATCPLDQPAQTAHRFICSVEIMAHGTLTLGNVVDVVMRAVNRPLSGPPVR